MERNLKSRFVKYWIKYWHIHRKFSKNQISEPCYPSLHILEANFTFDASFSLILVNHLWIQDGYHFGYGDEWDCDIGATVCGKFDVRWCDMGADQRLHHLYHAVRYTHMQSAFILWQFDSEDTIFLSHIYVFIPVSE